MDPELAGQLRARPIASDDMAELLLGGSELEQYLQDHPRRPGASPRGPRRSTEVRTHPAAPLDRGNLKSEFLQKPNLLMAKLDYAEGDYKEAPNMCAQGGPVTDSHPPLPVAGHGRGVCHQR